MIGLFIRYMFRIKPKERVGKPPRMFTSAYQQLDDSTARVMARLGVRSPGGLRVAMRRHKVESVDALAQRLRHHRPRRWLGRRFALLMARWGGGRAYDVYGERLRVAFKQAETHPEVKRRLREAVRAYERA